MATTPTRRRSSPHGGVWAPAFPTVTLHFTLGDFLETCLSPDAPRFDLVIATRLTSGPRSWGRTPRRNLAARSGLGGRIDRYHAFLIGIARALRPGGVAGVITSNRFMTTRGGGRLRAALQTLLAIDHVWDLGDTKLFDAAVLPAIILARGRSAEATEAPRFTSIYETTAPAMAQAPDVLAALPLAGPVQMADGRRFHVQHGRLDTSGPPGDLWRIATTATDAWHATVAAHTWGIFGRIGKIRVGVKTCADSVFIRSDWDTMPDSTRPELLRPLTTHHSAARFRATPLPRPYAILYPHESIDGQRRAADLTYSPKSRAYLESHRAALEGRAYVAASRRRWYELWVPQDPAAWAAPNWCSAISPTGGILDRPQWQRRQWRLLLAGGGSARRRGPCSGWRRAWPIRHSSRRSTIPASTTNSMPDGAGS